LGQAHTMEPSDEDAADPKSDKLRQMIDHLITTQEKSTTPKKLVMNAAQLQHVAKIGRKQAENLAAGHRVKQNEFITCVQGRYSQSAEGNKIDWARLGRDASAVMNETPRSCTMYGPLMKELKLRTTVVRQKHTPDVREKNSDAAKSRIIEGHKEDGSRENDEATKRIEEINLILTKQPKPVDVLHFITNPASFSETVENLFYVSFLVRDGSAKLTVSGDQKSLLLSTCERDKNAAKPATHQCITSLDEKKFQILCNEVKQSTIPPRSRS